jgi:hypothetical protein
MLNGLKRGQYTEAARLLGSEKDSFVLRVETVRQHARMQMSDLLLYDEDLQREYINVRGLTRSIGILSKTPAAVIEACQEYYRSMSAFPLTLHVIYISRITPSLSLYCYSLRVCVYIHA